MGRHASPKDRATPLYVQGPPKRIRLTAVRASGAKLTVELSTAEARATCALLARAIEEAEADKIATRGLPMPKKRKKKPTGRGSRLTPRKNRAPSRLKRVEAAAINLHTLLCDLVTEGEDSPLQLVGDSEFASGLLSSALQELQDSLGWKLKANPVPGAAI